MKILVIGSERQWMASKDKLGKKHEVAHQHSHHGLQSKLAGLGLVIDFNLAKVTSELETYADHPKLPLMINSVATSLHELKSRSRKPINNLMIGFNGLPTFFERVLWEITSLDAQGASVLMESLGQKFALTDDRVGMVTPRVICMIINEAYFTLQEGTASREDIDMAMKLGTNYPHGPFEWSRLIGVENVYELLSAVYEDTRDERYKICPLLKREYLAAVTQR